MGQLRKWDERFLDQAALVKTWSKDPRSKIGAIAVIDRRMVSQGYNGFPRDVYDSEERLNDRETKLKFVVHAEMNCIYNAARNGVSLTGATLYVDGLPTCSECAKGVIQSGIYRVVMRHGPIRMQSWAESFQLTKTMFNEAGVSFQCHEIPESSSGGNEPIKQADPRPKAELVLLETGGVAKRHGSFGSVLRELSNGAGESVHGIRGLGDPPNHYPKI